MREYESVFVLNPSVDETQVDAELDKIKEFLSSKNGEITEVQKWGRRKLAYEIGKNREGVYTLIRFNAEPAVPTELDRRYRLNESMLRYLTVLYERPPVGEGGEEGAEGTGDEKSPAVPATPAVPAEAKEAAAPAAAPKVEEPTTEEPATEELIPEPKAEEAKTEPGVETPPASEPAPESSKG